MDRLEQSLRDVEAVEQGAVALELAAAQGRLLVVPLVLPADPITKPGDRVDTASLLRAGARKW